MTERYLTQEVRELLRASEDETSDKHNMSSNDDGEYDQVLRDPVINSFSSDEENEDDGVANDSAVKSCGGSECLSKVPAASNCGKITDKNIVREKPGPTRFVLRMRSSITDYFTLFF